MTDRDGFRLAPRRDARVMGVCAGLATAGGHDATLIRVLTVLLALVAGPVILAAYIVAGLVAPR